MLAKIYSAAVYGVDAYEVEIEVNAGAGKPVMIIVVGGIVGVIVISMYLPLFDVYNQIR